MLPSSHSYGPAGHLSPPLTLTVRVTHSLPSQFLLHFQPVQPTSLFRERHGQLRGSGSDPAGRPRGRACGECW